MDVILTPAKLNGTITARPSVTSAFLHAVAQELAITYRPGGKPSAEDAQAVHKFIQEPMFWSPDLEVTDGIFRSLPDDAPALYCKGSRPALHLMMPIAAAMKEKAFFTGDPELADNHIIPLTDVLHRHGTAFRRGEMKIRRRDRGKFVEICTLSGRLEYGHFSLTGREDPWFMMGLLFALPLLNGNSTVRMTTLPETVELLEMGVAVMRQYGVAVNDSVDEYGYPHYEVSGNQHYVIPEEIDIDGDWTKAAFWLGCGALGGNVTVKELDGDSPQHSRQILDKLHAMGAGTGLGEDGANVTAASLKGCNLSAARIPDLVPILSVAMAAASGTSMLTDIGTSIGPVCETLEALGADVSYGGVGLSFTGRPFFNGGDIDPKGDPLVVMIAAAASCLCAEPVRIRNAGIVNKAYPDFFDDLAALGGKIRVEQ